MLTPSSSTSVTPSTPPLPSDQTTVPTLEETPPIGTESGNNRQSAATNVVLQNSSSTFRRQKRHNPVPDIPKVLKDNSDATIAQLMRNGDGQMSARFFVELLDNVIKVQNSPHLGRVVGLFTNSNLIRDIHADIFSRMSGGFTLWFLSQKLANSQDTVASIFNKEQASKLLERHQHDRVVVSTLLRSTSPETSTYLITRNMEIYCEVLKSWYNSNSYPTVIALRDLLVRRNPQTNLPWFSSYDVLIWRSKINLLPVFLFEDADVALHLWRIIRSSSPIPAQFTPEQTQGINFTRFEHTDFDINLDESIYKNILPRQVPQLRENIIRHLFNIIALGTVKSLRPETVATMCAKLPPQELQSFNHLNTWISQLDHGQHIEFLKNLPDTHLTQLPSKTIDAILGKANPIQYGNPEFIRLLPLATINKNNASVFLVPDVLRHFDKKIAGERCAAVFSPNELFNNKNVMDFFYTLDLEKQFVFLSGMPKQYIEAFPHLQYLIISASSFDLLDKIPDNFYAVTSVKWWEFILDDKLKQIKWEHFIEKNDEPFLKTIFGDSQNTKYAIAAWEYLAETERTTLPISEYPRWRSLLLKLVINLDVHTLSNKVINFLYNNTIKSPYVSYNYASPKDLKNIDIEFLIKLERSTLKDFEITHIIAFLFTEENISGLLPDVIKKLGPNNIRIWKALSHLLIYYFTKDQTDCISSEVLKLLLALKVFHKDRGKNLLAKLTPSKKELLMLNWGKDAAANLPPADRIQLRNAVETLPLGHRHEILNGVRNLDVYPDIVAELRKLSTSQGKGSLGKTVGIMYTSRFEDLQIIWSPDPGHETSIGNVAYQGFTEKLADNISITDMFLVTKDANGSTVYWKLKKEIISNSVSGDAFQEKAHRLNAIRKRFPIGGNIPIDEALKLEHTNLVLEIQQFWTQEIATQKNWTQVQDINVLPQQAENVFAIGHGSSSSVADFSLRQYADSALYILQHLKQPLHSFEVLSCETDRNALSTEIDNAFLRNKIPSPFTIQGYTTQVGPSSDSVSSNIRGNVYTFLNNIQYGNIAGRFISSPLIWKRVLDGNTPIIFEEFGGHTLHMYEDPSPEEAQAIKQYRSFIYDQDANEKVGNYLAVRNEIMRKAAQGAYLIQIVKNGANAYQAMYFNIDTTTHPNTPIIQSVEISRELAERFQAVEAALKPGLKYLENRYRLGANAIYERDDAFTHTESAEEVEKNRFLANALCRNSPPDQIELILLGAAYMDNATKRSITNTQWLHRWIQNRLFASNPNTPIPADAVPKMTAACKVAVMILKVEGEDPIKSDTRNKAAKNYLGKYPIGDQPTVLEMTRLQNGNMQLKIYDPKTNTYQLVPNNILKYPQSFESLVLLGHSVDTGTNKTIGGWSADKFGDHFQEIFANIRDIRKIHIDTCGTNTDSQKWTNFVDSWMNKWTRNTEFKNLELSFPLAETYISKEGHRLYVYFGNNERYHGLVDARIKFRRDAAQGAHPNAFVSEVYATKGSTLLIPNDPTLYDGPLGNPRGIKIIKDLNPGRAGVPSLENRAFLSRILEQSKILKENHSSLEAMKTRMGPESSEVFQLAQNVQGQKYIDDYITTYQAADAAVRKYVRAGGRLLSVDIKGKSQVQAVIYYDSTKTYETVDIPDAEAQEKLRLFATMAEEQQRHIQELYDYLRIDSHGEVTKQPHAAIRFISRFRGLGYSSAGKAALAGSNLVGISNWISFLLNPDKFKELPFALQVQFCVGLADPLAGGAREMVTGLKSLTNKFASRGVSLPNGLMNGLRTAGRLLGSLNGMLMLFSMAFDTATIASGNADENRKVLSIISLSGTTSAIIASMVAGPLAALPIAALTILVSTLVEAIMRSKAETKKTLDTLVDYDQILAKCAIKIENKWVYFDDVPILEIDCPNGTITFDSHEIRRSKHPEEELGRRLSNQVLPPPTILPPVRPGWHNLREGLGHAAKRTVTELSDVTVIQPPSDTKKKRWSYNVNPAPAPFSPTEEQKRVWDKLMRNRAVAGVTPTTGSGNNIVMPPSRLVVEEEVQVPLKIKTGPNSVIQIPVTAGKNGATYSTIYPGRSSGVILNFHHGVNLCLEDADPEEAPALLFIHILDGDLADENSITVDAKKEKIFIQHNDGKISEINISKTKASEIRIIGKKPTEWKVNAQTGKVELQGIQFKEYSSESEAYLIRLSEKGLTSDWVHETFAPPLPPPPAEPVLRTTKRENILGVETITEVITTRQTKTIKITKISRRKLERANGAPGTRNITTSTTISTPADDPIFQVYKNSMKAYLKSCEEIARNAETAVFSSKLKKTIRVPGAKLIKGTKDLFFYQPGLITRKDPLTDRVLKRYVIDPRHVHGEVHDFRQEGDQIFFRYHVRDTNNKNNSLDFIFEGKDKLTVKEIHGAKIEEQYTDRVADSSVTGRFRPTQLETGRIRFAPDTANLLKTMALQNAEAQENSTWIKLKCTSATSNQAFVYRYVHTSIAKIIKNENIEKIIIVRENDELIAQASSSEEGKMGLVFYSSEKKSAFGLKVSENANFAYDTGEYKEIENVTEARLDKDPHWIYLIIGNGKEVKKWNHLTGEIKTAQVAKPHAQSPSYRVESLSYAEKGQKVLLNINSKNQVVAIKGLNKEIFLRLKNELQEANNYRLFTLAEAKIFLDKRFAKSPPPENPNDEQNTNLLLSGKKQVIDFQIKYQNGSIVKLQPSAVRRFGEWNKPTDFKSVVQNGLKTQIEAIASRGFAQWVEIEAIDGEKYYVHSENNNVISIPAGYELIASGQSETSSWTKVRSSDGKIYSYNGSELSGPLLDDQEFIVDKQENGEPLLIGRNAAYIIDSRGELKPKYEIVENPFLTA